MVIPADHPLFVRQKLSVQAAGFFSGPQLLVNGVRAEGRRGKYVVMADSGEPAPVEVKNQLFDPVPRLKIGADMVELARPLTWYECVWLALPIALILIGGALGAVIGMAAVFFNARILRSDLPMAARYALSGGVSILALVIETAITTILRLLIFR